MNSEVRFHVWAAGSMLGLAALQVALGSLMDIGGVIPAFLLIGVLFLSQLRGQLAAMLHGFPAGILVDLYAGELVGITALALIIAGFAIGYTYDQERRERVIRSPRMVLLIAAGALLYHSVYVFSYIRSLDVDFLALLLAQTIGGTVYTTILGSILVLILARTTRKIMVE
ncbi:MAG: rod shape-determining protein MreD [Bacteroidia bacterium]|nr:rod shape-determining protein MreD [Bacteroidia bacterium]